MRYQVPITVPWEPRNAEAARLRKVIGRHSTECAYCRSWSRWSGQVIPYGHYAYGCRWAMELASAFIRAQSYGEPA